MRILALDIGTHSIKAVEFDVTFGRVELGGYNIERVLESELAEVHVGGPPGAARSEEDQAAAASAAATDVAAGKEPQPAPRQVLTQGQVAAIRRLLEDRPIKFDRLVVNIPRGWTTSRLFQFPTKDRKTIQNSLAFELDDDIPFTVAETVHDFAVVESEGQGSTVFAAVALKSDIIQLLTELQMLSLDPDTISIESWGLSHLLKRSVPKEYEGRPVCIVNIGNRNTAVHMFVNESPVLTHVSACAGMDVTRAIAVAYNLSFEEAEKAKVDGAFLLTRMHLAAEAAGVAESSPEPLGGTGETTGTPPAAAAPITEEQRHFADVIADALSPLVREIKQTLMAYKAQYKMQPRAVFITGGTSLIPNMQLYLEEQLSLPVFPLTYMSQVVGQTLQLSESSEAQISAAAGLGLSVVKVERHSHINFRKDDFVKVGGIGALDLRGFRQPLKYVAASLAFVFLNLIAQSFILSSRVAKQEETLARAMKSVLGPLPPGTIATYKNSPTALRNAVNKELAKYKTGPAVVQQVQLSAFDVLNKTSQQMPKDMKLDVSQFQFKEGSLRLTGVVDSSAATAKILKALEDTKVFSSVTKDKADEDLKLKRTHFEISAKVGK